MGATCIKKTNVKTKQKKKFLIFGSLSKSNKSKKLGHQLKVADCSNLKDFNPVHLTLVVEGHTRSAVMTTLNKLLQRFRATT